MSHGRQLLTVGDGRKHERFDDTAFAIASAANVRDLEFSIVETVIKC